MDRLMDVYYLVWNEIRVLRASPGEWQAIGKGKVKNESESVAIRPIHPSSVGVTYDWMNNCYY